MTDSLIPELEQLGSTVAEALRSSPLVETVDLWPIPTLEDGARLHIATVIVRTKSGTSWVVPIELDESSGDADLDETMRDIALG